MKTMSIEFTQMTSTSDAKEWISEIMRKLELRFDGADIEIKEFRIAASADVTSINAVARILSVILLWLRIVLRVENVSQGFRVFIKG